MTNETNFDDFKKPSFLHDFGGGGRKKVFAKQCGFSENMIYDYLNGSQEPGTKFYEGLKRKYPNVSVDWLLTGQGNPYLDQRKDVLSNVLDKGRKPATAVKNSGEMGEKLDLLTGKDLRQLS